MGKSFSIPDFYLGTHMPHWLAHTGPWFVSIRVLRRLRKWPKSMGDWCLDSGGFSELSLYGKWNTTADQYIEEVHKCKSDIGNLNWCAPMDWMCEPHIIANTGLDVYTHQVNTVKSFEKLRPVLGYTVIPVLQGWSPWDYLRHVDMYRANGIDLTKESVVGVGSICRRQHTASACTILNLLYSEGINIHAFGLKLRGLALSKQYIVSSDSMAWSFEARRSNPLSGHTHKNCANCLEYAEMWRDKAHNYILSEN